MVGERGVSVVCTEYLLPIALITGLDLGSDL